MADRIPLAHLPTPVEPMDRLGAALGMDEGALCVKRDDCTGLAGGGNKARKLEFLCGEALSLGCDTLVTGGGRQRNHARMTAAAELLEQVPDVDLVVVADGSGGTHAGLVAGFGNHERVLGVDVGTRPDLDEQVSEMADHVAKEAGRGIPKGAVAIDHGRFGA